jgi:hypothetical protein
MPISRVTHTSYHCYSIGLKIIEVSTLLGMLSDLSRTCLSHVPHILLLLYSIGLKIIEKRWAHCSECLPTWAEHAYCVSPTSYFAAIYRVKYYRDEHIVQNNWRREPNMPISRVPNILYRCIYRVKYYRGEHVARNNWRREPNMPTSGVQPNILSSLL